MNQRHWTILCALACTLVIVLGTSIARPATAPPLAPLVPSPVLVAAWAHVTSYNGTYSGENEQSGHTSLSERFHGNVVLTRIPNPNPNSPVISFTGTGDTVATGVGTCGTGSTNSASRFLLTVNLVAHTYDLSPEPNPGALQLSGGPSDCPKPFYNVVRVGIFFVRDALLPSPAAGICGTKDAQHSIAGGSETDKYSWSLVPTTDDHEKISLHCATVN